MKTRQYFLNADMFEMDLNNIVDISQLSRSFRSKIDYA